MLLHPSYPLAGPPAPQGLHLGPPAPQGLHQDPPAPQGLQAPLPAPLFPHTAPLFPHAAPLAPSAAPLAQQAPQVSNPTSLQGDPIGAPLQHPTPPELRQVRLAHLGIPSSLPHTPPPSTTTPLSSTPLSTAPLVTQASIPTFNSFAALASLDN